MVTLIVLLEVPRKEWLVKMVNTYTTKAVSVKSKKGDQRSIFLPQRLRTTKQIKQHKYRLINYMCDLGRKLLAIDNLMFRKFFQMVTRT